MKIKLLPAILVLIILFVVAELYPLPSIIWKQFHFREFRSLSNLSKLLRAKDIVYSNFQCAGIGLPSNCYILFAFTTELDKDGFNKIMAGLTSEDAGPVENHEDGQTFYSLLDIEANKTLKINGILYGPNRPTEPLSIAYYLKDSSVIGKNLGNKAHVVMYLTKDMRMEIDNMPTNLNGIVITYFLEEIGL